MKAFYLIADSVTASINALFSLYLFITSAKTQKAIANTIKFISPYARYTLREARSIYCEILWLTEEFTQIVAIQIESILGLLSLASVA